VISIEAYKKYGDLNKTTMIKVLSLIN